MTASTRANATRVLLAAGFRFEAASVTWRRPSDGMVGRLAYAPCAPDVEPAWFALQMPQPNAELIPILPKTDPRLAPLPDPDKGRGIPTREGK